MPTPLIQSLAKKANISIDKAEQAWYDARKEVDTRITDRRDKRYWPQVVAVCQRKLGLRESFTFKEYAELEFVTSTEPTLPSAAETNEFDSSLALGARLACLVAKLFGARDIAHKLHLTTHSFAQHEALAELYQLLASSSDEIAEVGMGITGVPLEFCEPDCEGLDSQSPREFIRTFIECFQIQLSGFEHIAITNVLEDLLSDIYRIKYKLEQLI